MEVKRPLDTAELIAGFASEKKADRILIMDMSRVSGVCDFFVVCSATSVVRAKTIAENIEEKMKSEGFRVSHREGVREGKWILLDYGDVITHIFIEDVRKRYDLESLWGDAPRRIFRSP